MFLYVIAAATNALHLWIICGPTWGLTRALYGLHIGPNWGPMCPPYGPHVGPHVAPCGTPYGPHVGPHVGQAARQTDRQIDRPTDRHTDRQTDRQTDRHTAHPENVNTKRTTRGYGRKTTPRRQDIPENGEHYESTGSAFTAR